MQACTSCYFQCVENEQELFARIQDDLISFQCTLCSVFFLFFFALFWFLHPLKINEGKMCVHTFNFSILFGWNYLVDCNQKSCSKKCFFFVLKYFRPSNSQPKNTTKWNKFRTRKKVDGGFALGEKAPGVFEI